MFALTLALALPAGVHGQPPPTNTNKKWKAQGPGPAVDGQSENVTPNNEVTGAIHTVLAHPTDHKTLYVGSVNGGVWRTKNAHTTSPNWKSLTDDLETSAIGALEFDLNDPKRKILWAGVGRFSSFGRLGGNRVGLYKSTNEGNSWTHLTGGGVLLGKNISGLAARGNTIVVAVDTADVNAIPNLGIWRSTDGGATFTQISVGNGAATGLPGGVTYDLVGDPTKPNRLFTSVVFANLVGGQNGVYRSNDTGATWTKVSNAAMDALLISGVTVNVEFAVRNDIVYAAIANSGRLAGLFRSADGGTTWTAMDLPRTGPTNVGIHPGGQASIHMSIVADPTQPNLVYIGGDRQPFRLEEGLSFPPQFPNTIGAENFSGRLFRCDASQPAGSQCTPLTHIGTASNSSPHADSRELTFDAAGNLIETDDGGIYKRTSPRTAAGDWLSINGDLQVSEQHDLSYDKLANIVFVGTQDNDDPHQDKKDKPDWFVLLSGDGGDTAVDNLTLGPSQSIRYDSAQGLQGFLRTIWDSANDLQAFVFPPLTVVGGAPFVGQFVTPVELNAITPTRLVIGGANGVYESFDQGDTITQISTVVVNGSGLDAVSYGGLGNPELLVVGSGDRVFIRTAAHPAPLTQVATYPGTGTGRTIRDIVVDPDNAGAIYLTNLNQVYRTLDGGTTWTDVTGNLQTFLPIALRAIEYVPRSNGSGTNDALVVSTFNGIYVAHESTGFTVWEPLGKDLPKVAILDLHYQGEDKALVAGTLGRGAWKLKITHGDDEDDEDDEEDDD
ncbi:MAG TPA: sialidase family protein [Thermoanaerobaculia bacterium]|nr:sialidase family protein [Thermoanaerobaculia bacterium]